MSRICLSGMTVSHIQLYAFTNTNTNIISHHYFSECQQFSLYQLYLDDIKIKETIIWRTKSTLFQSLNLLKQINPQLSSINKRKSRRNVSACFSE